MGNKNGSSNKRKIINFSTETINIESNEDKKKRTSPNLENVKQEGNFDNIKSKYILKKIFDNLDKNKSLKIINYNTKLQKSLDINIKDYKKFYEIYSPIEIEIVPIKKYIKILIVSLSIWTIFIYILIIIKKKLINLNFIKMRK